MIILGKFFLFFHKKYMLWGLTEVLLFFGELEKIFTEISSSKQYLVTILGHFFLFLHKNICCGYSLFDYLE